MCIRDSRSAGEYADLAALPKLYAAMEKLVEEQGMTRLLHFEQQLTVVLAAMEHDGIAIDRQGVEDFGVYLSEQIEEMQQMVYDEAGHTFNLSLIHIYTDYVTDYDCMMLCLTMVSDLSCGRAEKMYLCEVASNIAHNHICLLYTSARLIWIKIAGKMLLQRSSCVIYV